LNQPWAIPQQRFLLDEQLFIADVHDDSACFNLNSMGQKDTKSGKTPEAVKVFRQWLINLQLSEIQADTVADSLRDWIDADNQARPMGAENDYYQQLSPARLAANRPLSEVSELRNVRGVDAALYRRLQKQVCVLPEKQLKININTLPVASAPLLSAVFLGKLSVRDATQLLQSRPAKGWDSVEVFLQNDVFTTKQANKQESQGVLSQSLTLLSVDSDYFTARIRQDVQQNYRLMSRYQRSKEGIRVIQRQYGFSD
jgi:general secretion pathway protein K